MKGKYLRKQSSWKKAASVLLKLFIGGKGLVKRKKNSHIIHLYNTLIKDKHCWEVCCTDIVQKYIYSY